jgi:hypothetical protein
MSEMKWLINIFKGFFTKKVDTHYEDEFEDMFLYAESHLHITRIESKPKNTKVIAYRKKK